MEEAETPEECRRRRRREASARWKAKPGNADRKRETQARWRAENPEAKAKWYGQPENREREREAKANWNVKNRAQVLLNACRRNARGRGHDCSLTLDDVQALIRPMACSVTGVQLSWEWDGPGSNPWVPSIDRVDGSYGYHLENVRVVCWAFNRARGDWPDSTFATLAQAFVTTGARAHARSSPIDGDGARGRGAPRGAPTRS